MPERLTTLLVTAVEAEAHHLREGLGAAAVDAVHHTWGVGPRPRCVILVAGVGPASAAAATARTVMAAWAAGERLGGVVSAGIGGGFHPRAGVGAIALARRSVATDLGADSDEGFLPLETLGFGQSIVDCDGAIVDALRRALPTAVVGDIVTASTVTGTSAGLDTIRGRCPDAVAEAMEGFGVATAAGQAGLGFAEIRTISNLVGPRDRSAWRLDLALTALTTVGRALVSLEW